MIESETIHLLKFMKLFIVTTSPIIIDLSFIEF